MNALLLAFFLRRLIFFFLLGRFQDVALLADIELALEMSHTADGLLLVHGSDLSLKH